MVSDVVADKDGKVKLPAVTDADPQEFDYNVKYSMDNGKTWYTASEANALSNKKAGNPFPINENTPDNPYYTVTVGVFFGIGLLEQIDAHVTINATACDITYDGPVMCENTCEEKSKSSEDIPTMASGMTVQLDLDGGEFDEVPAGLSLVADDLYKFAAPLSAGYSVKGIYPKKENYVFNGWSDPVVDTSANTATLTAQWLDDSVGGGEDGDESDGIPDIYQRKVTYTVVNGTFGGTDTSKFEYVTLLDEEDHWSAEGSGEITPPDNKQANTGYTEKGWDPELPEDNIITYEEDEYAYEFEYDPNNNDLTYPDKAIAEDQYSTDTKDILTGKTVTLILAGGAFTQDDKTALLNDDWKEGSDYIKTVYDDEEVDRYPKRLHYVFDGWNYEEDSTTKNVNLTAKWLADNDDDGIPDIYQRTIIYKVKNGTWFDTTFADITEKVTLMKDNKWDAVDGTATLTRIPTGMIAGVGYNATGVWDNTPPTTVNASSELTYTHKFLKMSLIVSYALDGGIGEPGVDYSPVTVDYGDKVTVKPGVRRDMKKFIGWTDGENIYQPGDVVVITASKTFRPVWEFSGPEGRKIFTVTFETNGGTRIASKRVRIFAPMDEPDAPQKDGSTFAGWYEDKALTIPYDFSEIVSRDMILYAKWSVETGVSELLLTGDHIKYLNGYTDGTFKPENNMTRAEVAQMFYNLLLNKDVEGDAHFDDVDDNKWYAKAVITLANLGIIKGVDENRFAPDAPITRAQFTAIAMRFTAVTVEGEVSFTDVSASHWAADYIRCAALLGWINGNGDGTFRPDAYIKRCEVAKIVNKMLERSADLDYISAHDDLTFFEDVSEDAWYFGEVEEAVNAHGYTKIDGREYWN